MAKETTSTEDAHAPGGSLSGDDGYGMGENTDGTFNIFPASELAERIAKRDAEEAATEYAMNQIDDPFLEDDGDNEDE
jgi:uncharacterized protein with von Willebrand factor type A (vWA) domain